MSADRTAIRERARSERAAPRVAFLGLGWIGRARLRALRASGLAEITALIDPDARARDAAADEAPDAAVLGDLARLDLAGLDGLVIATPSALHAEQARAALAAGVAVFCEKPLGRGPAEVSDVLRVARTTDRLLAVDLSYRHTNAARALRGAVRGGEIGQLRFADLIFHNAYGPDKPWFTSRALAGGGCLIDLGTHLIDLLRWIAGGADGGDPDAARVVAGGNGAGVDLRVQAAALRRAGRPLAPDSDEVEDFALAQLTFGDALVRLACSWFLPAGRDCVLECSLYGSDGAVSMRNLDGSFYDFVAERHVGGRRERLAGPPEDWGAGAITAWARRLARDPSFDPAAEELLDVAETLERIARWSDPSARAAR